MAGTVNKEIGVTTVVLRRAAHVWRWIPSAPKIERVKGPTRRAYVLSWPEQINVFKRLVGDLQKICLFAVNTGCRREEIFDLKWKDQIDVDGVTVFVARDTKNGEDRPIICNSISARVVGYMRDGHFQGRPRPGYVFPRMTVSKILNKAWVAAGLPDEKLVKKGIHNLRHTYGYRLRQAGVQAEDRDSLLGHNKKSMSQHYAIADLRKLVAFSELTTIRNDDPVLR
jgi:integrase